MKTPSSILLIALIGTLLLTTPAGCGQKIAPKASVADQMPAAAEMAVTAPGLVALFEHFSVTESTIFGRAVPAKRWQARLGFNPLVPAAWAERGIDPAGPMALALRGLDLELPADVAGAPVGDAVLGADFALLICLPAADLDNARSAARNLVETALPDAVVAEEAGILRFSSAAENVQGAVADRNDTLLVALGPGGGALPLIQDALNAEDRLSGVEGYKAAARSMGPEDDLLVFADFVRLRDRLRAAGETLEGAGILADQAKRMARYAADYRWGAAWLDLDRSDLRVAGMVAVRKDSPLSGALTDKRPGRKPLLHVPSPPLLLALGGMAPETGLRTLREGMTESEREAFDARMAAAGAQLGIDLERDLVENFTGGFGFGVFDGVSLNMANHNTIFSAGVKDAEKARKTLDAAADRLRQQGGMTVTETRVGETDAYALNVLGFLQFFVGVHEDRLLVSAGRRMFQEAVSAEAPRPGPDPEVAAAWAEDPAVFYLDVDQLVQAGRNFSFLPARLNRGRPMDARAAEPLKDFRYLMSSARTDGDRMIGELRVATRFSEPFFQAVVPAARALAERLSRRPAVGGSPSEAPAATPSADSGDDPPARSE
ncbi:MAG: hypothetical protein ACLFRG_15320 [Desulfococcaceae bacterium]